MTKILLITLLFCFILYILVMYSSYQIRVLRLVIVSLSNCELSGNKVWICTPLWPSELSTVLGMQKEFNTNFSITKWVLAITSPRAAYNFGKKSLLPRVWDCTLGDLKHVTHQDQWNQMLFFVCIKAIKFHFVSEYAFIKIIVSLYFSLVPERNQNNYVIKNFRS